MNIYTLDNSFGRMIKNCQGIAVGQLDALIKARDDLFNKDVVKVRSFPDVQCLSNHKSDYQDKDVFLLHESQIKKFLLNDTLDKGSVVLFSGGAGDLLKDIGYASRVYAFKHPISDAMFEKKETWVEILKYLLKETTKRPEAFIDYSRMEESEQAKIKKAAKDKDMHAYIYSNPEDFSALWKMLINQPGEDLTKHIVIYWDWLPEHSIAGLGQANPQHILTPYDWALAYSYKRHATKQPIPWISIVRFNDVCPNIPKEICNKAFWIGRFVEKYTKEKTPFFPPARSPCFASASDTPEMKSLMPLIKAHFSKEIGTMDNHHAAANLIAPALMDCGLPEQKGNGWMAGLFEKKSYLQFAALCCWINVLYAQEKLTKKNNLPSDFTLLPYDQPRFVLIDDQKDLFDGVLKKALCLDSKKNQCRFISFESVDKYTLDNGNKNQDIIFLDLRLGENNDKTSYLTSDASPELKTQWTKINQRLQNDTDNEKEALTPLTLRPLLLAADNPSRPIIIFSSTQQRYVTEIFKVCPNIITSFTKPYPGKYRETMDPKVIMDGFYETVTSALEMYEVGIVWREAQEKINHDCNQLEWCNRAGEKIEMTEDGDKPVNWLKWKWLPVMQRGDYAIGAAMPWMYVRTLLGGTRLAILERQLIKPDGGYWDNKGRLLQIMQRGHSMFPLKRKTKKTKNSGDQKISRQEQRKIAIAVGLAFVALMADWCPKASDSGENSG